MKKKRNAVPGSGDQEPPIVVRSRRQSRLPIVIPVPRGLDPEALELKRAQRIWRGTTPLEREIIRKITIRARRKLFPGSDG